MEIAANNPDGLTVNHVELYVTDVQARAVEFVEQFGFTEAAYSGPGGGRRTKVLVQGSMVLLLSQGLTDEDPATEYVQRHGDGIADIALRVKDCRGAFEHAVAAGARPVRAPVRRQTPHACTVATVVGFGDVVHTFVQHDGAGEEACAPGFPVLPLPSAASGGLERMDHFAVCLPAGDLNDTVAYYESGFGFQMIFEERIRVGRQAMSSKVVQSPSGDVTLTLIEPDTTAEAGQVDDFIKDHGGAGVQHIAFRTPDIVAAVTAARARGVEFLKTPDPYYRLLPHRLELAAHEAEELRRLHVLVDEDHYGQLFQIFTRSLHPRQTLFFEIIERIGARTFGTGNIKALYEAVEFERVHESLHEQ